MQCFQSTLLPGFESAVKEMFQQLDSTVSAGLQQHAQVCARAFVLLRLLPRLPASAGCGCPRPP